MDQPLVTFCMGLKNRSQQALQTIRNLVTPANHEFFKFTIVEDTGEDLLDLAHFEHRDLIKYHLVVTGDSWNRSKVLNFGGRRVFTPYVAFWDADFIFPANFTIELLRLLKEVEMQYIVAIECYESGDSIIGETKKSKGDRYGRLWLYPTKAFKQVRGFDERFIGWGKEERDLERRVCAECGLQTFYTWKKRPSLFVKHKSHNDDSRGISYEAVARNIKLTSQNQKKKLYVVNDEKWGLFPEVKA